MKAKETGRITAYVDGGARGNPGPAAFGVVILVPQKGSLFEKAGTKPFDGVQGKEYAETIGITTNNEAEYQGAIFALKKIKQLIGKAKAKKAKVEVRSDSELLVEQANGRYKVVDPPLQTLFMELWNLRIDFGDVLFVHVPREENRRADMLLNRALDDRYSTGGDVHESV